MNRHLGTRAAADRLAALLDGGGSGVAAPPPAALLATRLAGLAGPVATPDAAFRAALRTRLVAVAGVQAGQPAVPAARTVPWSQGRRVQRGMTLAAGAMASVVAVTGIAVASSRALPGDPFYGVKRQAEALQLRFANGSVEQGTRHLEFAETRLQEVRGLTLGRRVLSFAPSAVPLAGGLAFGGSVEARVRSTLGAMDRETQVGTALLTTAYRDTRSANPLRILTAFAGRQTQTLQTLLPDLPVTSRDRAQSSLSLVTRVGQQAGVLLGLGECTQACNPAAAAPLLPTSAPAGPTPDPHATGDAPCTCPTTEPPATAPAPSTEPSPSPTTSATAEPTPTPTPVPSPTRTPAPKPSPSSNPLPLPTPSVSVPPLPVPLPSTPAPGPTGIPGLPLPLVPLVSSLLPSVLPHP